ncbi:hypothetical protein VTN00DRAFT_7318 [Thermoascus crustaceus]|uniref:uncharacterized protein n=1 Tax=Thermoascus crustaceus TaxID=5088 RepID=UPI0037428A36
MRILLPVSSLRRRNYNIATVRHPSYSQTGPQIYCKVSPVSSVLGLSIESMEILIARCVYCFFLFFFLEPVEPRRDGSKAPGSTFPLPRRMTSRFFLCPNANNGTSRSSQELSLGCVVWWTKQLKVKLRTRKHKAEN